MRTISPTIHSTDGVKTRLIDWGLAFKYNKNGSLPNEILDRPLQYNIPFSSILFQSDIQNVIDNYVYNYNTPGSNYAKNVILRGLF